MKRINTLFKYRFMFLFSVLLSVSLVFPILTEPLWLNIVGKIREAINSGDSGPLVLASALNSIVYALQNALVFLTAYTGVMMIGSRFRLRFGLSAVFLMLFYAMISMLIAKWQLKPWETFSGLFISGVIILLNRHSYKQASNYHRMILVTILVFFAFQWLNIMPAFSIGPFGVTDIPVSIKITSQYLGSNAVLNFVGMAFFIPLFLAAWTSTALFMSHDRTISVEKENHSKEIKLEALKASAMEHRIYQEINSIAHDLKTPLVTIKGLNSLLSMTSDLDKATVYSEKIDSAVEKMSDMISGFLYETSRLEIEAVDLINYMRAQIPLDDNALKISMNTDDILPKIKVNKIRVSRALLNIVENAIFAPTKFGVKEILIKAACENEMLNISITDNGTGIPIDILEKVWEPGYSTKGSTGLGLYFVKKIVEDNEGTVEIISEPNIGTTVTVRFPVAERG